MSRKHSSIENCSRTGAISRQSAMKFEEQVSYQAKSEGATYRPGHFCSAMETGSPVRIPYFFAGMDFAVTTLVLFFGSPPMTAGISRRSLSPF